MGLDIAGQRVAGSSGRQQPVWNPTTGAVARQGGAGQRRREIAAGGLRPRAAFPAWADTPPIRRARVMQKFLELMNQHRDTLAAMITAEHGKVFTDAQGEVTRGIDIVEFACGILQLLRATTLTRSAPASTTGRCASRWAWWPASRPSTSPWCQLDVPGIACGNAFILKPASATPSDVRCSWPSCWQAGLPDGVFNVVQGDKLAVDTMLTHPDMKAIVSFVGSTPIAQYIYETGAHHGKRVQALGGAKNHMVVMPTPI